MKKLFYQTLIILILLIPGITYAQEEQQSFEEKHQDKDAIFLLLDTSVELKEDYSYIIKIHKKIKILTEEAKILGDTSVPYEKDRERITQISAYTITPDGEKHRAKIQDMREYEGYRMYSDTRSKVITFPEVNPGSILELEATIVTDEPMIKNTFWMDFRFDSFNTPIKNMHCKFSYPKHFNMHYAEFNIDNKPVITEGELIKTYSWDIKNLYTKKGIAEKLLPPVNLDTVEGMVEFSTIGKWSDVSNWYYASAQKNLIIDDKIKRVASEIFKDSNTIKNKARAALEYIQDNFRYVSMSFGVNRLEPHPTDEVFKNKYGDCKDLSLLCLALLQLAGVEANLVLFSDEESITDPQYDPPFPTLFDHVLLLVKDEESDFYIDPLLKRYDIGEYPFSYQRAYTFIITDTGGRFDRFPEFNEKRAYTKKMSTITINNDGSAVKEIITIWNLDESLEAKSEFASMSEEDKKRFHQVVKNNYSSRGELLDFRLEGLDDRYGILNDYVKYSSEETYPIIGDIIVIDIAGYGNNSIFMEENRKNPMFLLFNSLDEYKTTYRIPEGFRVSHIPDDFDLNIGFSIPKDNME